MHALFPYHLLSCPHPIQHPLAPLKDLLSGIGKTNVRFGPRSSPFPSFFALLFLLFLLGLLGSSCVLCLIGSSFPTFQGPSLLFFFPRVGLSSCPWAWLLVTFWTSTIAFCKINRCRSYFILLVIFKLHFEDFFLKGKFQCSFIQ